MDRSNKLAEFLEEFINTPEPDINENYLAIEKQYVTLFGHSVPREMIPNGISEHQLISALKECVDSKSDNLFKLLGVSINYDNLY